MTGRGPPCSGCFAKDFCFYLEHPQFTLRILGMSWAAKTTCFEAPGVSLGGSGVSIRGFRILRVPRTSPI